MTFLIETLLLGIIFIIATIGSLVVTVLALLGKVYMNVYLWIILVFALLFFVCGAVLFTWIALNEIRERRRSHEN